METNNLYKFNKFMKTNIALAYWLTYLYLFFHTYYDTFRVSYMPSLDPYFIVLVTDCVEASLPHITPYVLDIQTII